MAWQVDWRVTIDGRDVTSAMRPFLTDIRCTDADGAASDTCSLTFDDAGGQAVLPQAGARVVVWMNGTQVFQGTVDSVRSNGSRGGGRTLTVGAKGHDPAGKAKQGQQWHLDDASLGDALNEGAREAGLVGIVVDPEFAKIQRDYWSPDGQSFIHWAGRIARELGGTFKIRGDRAVLAKRGTGRSATGAAMPTVSADVGRNVISWDIEPVRTRPRYRRAKVRFFDRETADFQTREVEVGDVPEDEDEDEGADEEVLTLAHDGDEADRIAAGRKASAERETGGGTIVLDLAPEAQAEGTIVLRGARPGIDGTYRISGVTHSASRSGGATTSVEIKQPGGEAGRDKRKPTGKGGARETVAAPSGGVDPLPTIDTRGSGTGFEGSPEIPGQR